MKRPLDGSAPSSPKRPKMETDESDNLHIVESPEEEKEWKPTHIILSGEAFSVSILSPKKFFSNVNFFLIFIIRSWKENVDLIIEISYRDLPAKRK